VCVQVEAFDAAGNRSAATEGFLSTAACADTTPPVAPASVTMASRTQTSISVTWPAATDNLGVVGYGVYRAGTKVEEITERAYTFAGLTCGMNYTLGVDSYDAAGNRSAVTTVLIATTACPDTTAPTAPTNLAASAVTATGLTLSWSASTDNVGVTKYEVSRNGTLVASPTTTSSNQTGLLCGTTYAFVVLAVDAAGNRSTPAQLSASTTACADTIAPTAPTNLTATSVTTTGLTLSWSAATDNVGVARYELSRNGTLVASPTTTSLNQTGLSCGTSYSYAVLAVDAAGNRSTPAQLSTSTAACTQTGPAPTLQPIDGGTSYFARFANTSGMDALSYFPVAVWGAYNQTQGNRDLDATAGLNTYVWAADNSYVDDIRADGRFKVIQDEGNRANVGSETAGWLLGDEIDMCCGPPGFAGGNGYDMLSSTLAGLPQDNRLRFANYGKGVLLWESDADAARFINGRTGPNSFQQVVSADLYWFTDPNESGNSRKGFGSSYGDDVTRMRFLDAMDGARMPVWAFVETGWPFTESAGQGGRSIQPAELRSAVWHALIAGARGIIYFEHSFGGPCLGDHHTIRSNCEGTRPMVTSVNAQVKSLAAVLNSPSVTSGHSVTDTMTGNARDMVKWDGSNFYVFAGADKGGGNATFSMPCVGNATATVLGESRTVAVSGGSFTDSFADKNAVHIYRIDGGSRCGL
jgi:chitodextrinase